MNDSNGNGTKPPPHSLTIERGLLGACMVSPQVIEECFELVTASDFYSPAHGSVWASICRVWESGAICEAMLVADDLKRHDALGTIGGPGVLLEMVADAPVSVTAANYAQRIAGMAGMRRLVKLALDVKDAAMADHDLGPSGLVDLTHARLDELDMGVAQVPDTFVGSIEEFMDRPRADRKPWVIPGQLRKGHRIVFVAEEGVGKSLLLRQMALCVSQGVNPFMPQERVEPQRALVIDLENPDDAIEEQMNMILPTLRSAVADEDWDSTRFGLLREPGGMNLRHRRDRALIEATLAAFRPDIVVAGPAYKMYELEGDRHETAVMEIQRAWDKWRTRFDFALVLEHHAPMSTGDGKGRNIRPSDTMLWLRWPEFGVSLKRDRQKDDDNVFKFGRWRGDRVKTLWPQSMRHGRGGELPWVFSWPTGTFTTGSDKVAAEF